MKFSLGLFEFVPRKFKAEFCAIHGYNIIIFSVNCITKPAYTTKEQENTVHIKVRKFLDELQCLLKKISICLIFIQLYSFIKKRASQALIYQKTCKNVHLKCFWTRFKNMHCQGPCILRPCISRPYCISRVWTAKTTKNPCINIIKSLN